MSLIAACNIKMTYICLSFPVGNLRCTSGLTPGKLGEGQDVRKLHSYPQTRKELEDYMYVKP